MSTSNSRIIIGLEDRQGRIKTFFEEDAPCSHIGENWGGYIVKFIRYKNGPRKNYSYFEKIHWRFLATICLTFAWIAVYPIAGMLIPLLLSTGMEILLYCHESGLRGIIRDEYGSNYRKCEYGSNYRKYIPIAREFSFVKLKTIYTHLLVLLAVSLMISTIVWYYVLRWALTLIILSVVLFAIRLYVL